MKLIIEDSVDTITEIEVVQTILEIADFDVGKSFMFGADQSNIIVAGGNITLENTNSSLLFIDPNGTSRNIYLPLPAIDNHGFLIFNTADVDGELLHVICEGFGEIGTVYRGGAGWFVSSGLVWKSAGLGTTDIATKRVAHWRAVAAVDDLTVADGIDYMVIPYELNGMNLVSAHAAVDTASSSETPTIQLRNVTDSADMLSTRITIDVNEHNSYTATIPPVIDTSHDDVATGDRIAIDVDVKGTGTKGLVVILVFQVP